MAKPRLIAAYALAVLAIIWILQNTGAVQTKFLFVTVTMPQAALLAITLLAGAGGGLLLAMSLGGKWSLKDKYLQPCRAAHANTAWWIE